MASASIALRRLERVTPRRRKLNPLWLTAPGVALLVTFLIYPTIRVLSLSVIAPAGGFSLAMFHRLFATPVYVRVLQTTFVIAAETTILCLLFGYPLAYWLSKQPMRRQQGLMLLVLLPFWTSPLVLNFAWLVLLGRNGAFRGILKAIGFINPPDVLFTKGVVLFSLTHSMMPLAVVTMLPVMAQIDRELTKAAATLGATTGQAFWRIYFHLSMPGVAAAGLLIFISSLGFFITPAILGGPRQTMLSQLIISQIQDQQNWPFGATLAVMLMVVSVVTCVLHDRVFGMSSVSGGSTGSARNNRLRRFGILVARGLAAATGALHWLLGGRRMGWVLPAYSITLLVLSLVPIVAFLPMGFTSSTFLSFPPPGYSVRWFVAYFDSPIWISATVRSFGIGFATATITLLVATLAAFGISRTTSRWSSAAFTLFLLPMVVPSIVIAISLFYLLAQMRLIATNLGIMIGHVVIAIPIAFVVVLAVLKNYDWRYDQAAATLGADRRRILMRITLPLIRKGLLAAFIFAFLQSFQELTIALFIGGGIKTTLPKQMWDDITLQINPILAAASVVVMVIVTSLFMLGGSLRAREGKAT